MEGLFLVKHVRRREAPKSSFLTLKKVILSLVEHPFSPPPSPRLSGPASEKITFFAASLRIILLLDMRKYLEDLEIIFKGGGGDQRDGDRLGALHKE